MAPQATFGVANYTIGIIMSSSKALTSASRYTPKMKATDIPKNLPDETQEFSPKALRWRCRLRLQERSCAP